MMVEYGMNQMATDGQTGYPIPKTDATGAPRVQAPAAEQPWLDCVWEPAAGLQGAHSSSRKNV